MKKILGLAIIAIILTTIFTSCDPDSKDKEYTVTFMADDDVYTTQTVKEGQKASKPATNPVKTNYTFVKWLLNNTEFDFDTVIMSDITLVASFELDDPCKNGHDFSVFVSTLSATCTEAGYDVYKCSRCTETTNINQTNALGHDYSVFVSTVSPTCTTAGYDIYKCSRCTQTEHKNPTVALGHTYTAEWGPETNTVCVGQTFTQSRPCNVCGHVDTRQAEGIRSHILDDPITHYERVYFSDTHCRVECHHPNCDYAEELIEHDWDGDHICAMCGYDSN